jgi:hypothetical protein
VRLNARRFVIAPGHVVAELEHEVERHARHAVVETHPDTSDFAERTDHSQRAHRLRIRAPGSSFAGPGRAAKAPIPNGSAAAEPSHDVLRAHGPDDGDPRRPCNVATGEGLASTGMPDSARPPRPKGATRA